MRRGEAREDTRVLRDWSPCPTPSRCDFVGGRCKSCGKRAAIHEETLQLSMLAVAMDGGLQVNAEDMHFGIWIALGVLRAARHAPRVW